MTQLAAALVVLLSSVVLAQVAPFIGNQEGNVSIAAAAGGVIFAQSPLSAQASLYVAGALTAGSISTSGLLSGASATFTGTLTVPALTVNGYVTSSPPSVILCSTAADLTAAWAALQGQPLKSVVTIQLAAGVYAFPSGLTLADQPFGSLVAITGVDGNASAVVIQGNVDIKNVATQLAISWVRFTSAAVSLYNSRAAFSNCVVNGYMSAGAMSALTLSSVVVSGSTSVLRVGDHSKVDATSTNFTTTVSSNDAITFSTHSSGILSRVIVTGGANTRACLGISLGAYLDVARLSIISCTYGINVYLADVFLHGLDAITNVTTVLHAYYSARVVRDSSGDLTTYAGHCTTAQLTETGGTVNGAGGTIACSSM